MLEKSLLCGNTVLNMYADNSKINVITILLKDGTHFGNLHVNKSISTLRALICLSVSRTLMSANFVFIFQCL